MRFDSDCDIADLSHGVFGGVLGIFDEETLFLVRFRPVLFEEAFTDPSLSRSRERLGQNTAFRDGLVVLWGEVVGLGDLDGWQRLAMLDRGWQRRWRRRGRRLLDNGFWRRPRWRSGSFCTMASRRIAALGELLCAGRSPGRQLSLPLHGRRQRVVEDERAWDAAEASKP